MTPEPHIIVISLIALVLFFIIAWSELHEVSSKFTRFIFSGFAALSMVRGMTAMFESFGWM